MLLIFTACGKRVTLATAFPVVITPSTPIDVLLPTDATSPELNDAIVVQPSTSKITSTAEIRRVDVCIHMGSFSIDHNDLTKQEIETAVEAVAKYIPNADCVVIGTFLDYPEQIRFWVDAIHKTGKSAFVRSSGYNSWQKTFGADQIGTPEQHLHDVAEWIKMNHSLFKDGGVFEPFPDKPSNGLYWKKYPYGVGTNSTSLMNLTIS